MIKILPSILVMMILCSGCVTGEKMTRLRPGMSKIEVEKVLGRPDGYEKSESQEAYKYIKRMRSGWSWDQADYVLLFEDDKLVKYGPATIYPREFQNNTQTINIRWL